MESWKVKFLKLLPFSYLWILNRFLGNGIKTVLDLGCGEGSIMKSMYSKDWEVIGVDVFGKSLQKARLIGCYTELIKGDVNTVCRNLIKKKRKFDVVLGFELIEHLDRLKGEELLGLVDKLAKKRAIFTTPRGYMDQIDESLLEGNPYQFHKSGWNIYDFTSRGYKVVGVGFILFWSRKGLARSRNSFISFFAKLISFIFSPLVYHLPSLGTGIIATKNYDN